MIEDLPTCFRYDKYGQCEKFKGSHLFDLFRGKVNLSKVCYELGVFGLCQLMAPQECLKSIQAE